jgi:hypothetical protein
MNEVRGKKQDKTSGILCSLIDEADVLEVRNAIISRAIT